MRVLEFVFKSDANKTRTLKFNYAKADLSEAVARDLMGRISALEMFQKEGSKLYAKPVAARYVETDTKPIFDDAVKA